MYQEPAGSPIVRLTKQLRGLGAIIYRELGVWVRTPEGVWDWPGKKRRELKSLCKYLTNRETFGYFRGANIAKTHKLRTAIQNHCMAMGCMAMRFTKQMESGESGDSQDAFGKFLRTIGEYLNTDAPVNNSGNRMFTITQN